MTLRIRAALQGRLLGAPIRKNGAHINAHRAQLCWLICPLPHLLVIVVPSPLSLLRTMQRHIWRIMHGGVGPPRQNTRNFLIFPLCVHHFNFEAGQKLMPPASPPDWTGHSVEVLPGPTFQASVVGQNCDRITQIDLC